MRFNGVPLCILLSGASVSACTLFLGLDDLRRDDGGDGGGEAALPPGVCDKVYVSALSGSDANDGCRVVQPKRTIGAALASLGSQALADAGAMGAREVDVCAGTYAENVTLDVAVSLRGGFDCTTWAPSAAFAYPAFPEASGSTLQGIASSPSSTALLVTGGAIAGDVTISGFTVRGADALGSPSVAVAFEAGAHPTFAGNHVVGGAAGPNLAAGLIVTGASPKVQGNRIEAGTGSLTYALSAADPDQALVIDGNTVVAGSGHLSVAGDAIVGLAVTSSAPSSAAFEITNNQIGAGKVTVAGGDMGGAAFAFGGAGAATAHLSGNVIDEGALTCAAANGDGGGATCALYGIFWASTGALTMAGDAVKPGSVDCTGSSVACEGYGVALVSQAVVALSGVEIEAPLVKTGAASVEGTGFLVDVPAKALSLSIDKSHIVGSTVHAGATGTKTREVKTTGLRNLATGGGTLQVMHSVLYGGELSMDSTNVAIWVRRGISQPDPASADTPTVIDFSNDYFVAGSGPSAVNADSYAALLSAATGKIEASTLIALGPTSNVIGLESASAAGSPSISLAGDLFVVDPGTAFALGDGYGSLSLVGNAFVGAFSDLLARGSQPCPHLHDLPNCTTTGSSNFWYGEPSCGSGGADAPPLCGLCASAGCVATFFSGAPDKAAFQGRKHWALNAKGIPCAATSLYATHFPDDVDGHPRTSALPGAENFAGMCTP